MSERYYNWLRLRTPDGFTPSGEAFSVGRKLLSEVLESAERGGFTVAKRTITTMDGTVVVAQFDGTTPLLTIFPAGTDDTTTEQDLSGVWIPRGFVCRPATSGYPYGAGLPAVQDGDNPEARRNLQPLTDITQWTSDGPCAEVLLSPDANAGFQPPKLMKVPLLYNSKYGPVLRATKEYDVRPPSGAWAPYRLRFSAWDSFYDDEVAVIKRAVWQGINVYRDDHGLASAYLWPDGYYRPGQLTANVLKTNGDHGATSTSYPTSYQTPAQRLTKDGYTISAPPGTDVLNTDSYGMSELRAAGASAASAVAGWVADSASEAVLADDTTNGLFIDVGHRAGYITAAVVQREEWIEAGCAAWTPGDGRMAPLSWRSFRSLNYGFETLPCNFTGDSTYPLSVASQFTGAAGVWLSYYRSPSRSEPALDRYVYCRGRAIARLPNDGLVWAAGVMALDDVDRLIVIAHHASDQPAVSAPSSLAYGMTRYVRVWWCDVPRRTMALDADRTISGTDPADPYSWKGGTLVDVTGMPSAPELPIAAPNALKYASAWRFSPDGTKAACLRDYGALANYATFNSATTATVAYGLFPRTLELVFTATPTALDVAAQWKDMTPGWTTDPRVVTSLPDVTLPTGATAQEGTVVPIAVDYDANGALVYAYTSDCAITTVADIVKVTYAGTGNAAVQYASQLSSRALVSAEYALGTLDFRYTGYLQCLDVRSGVFVADGTRARLRMDYTTGVGIANTAFQPCRDHTSATVHGLKMWKGGVTKAEKWLPCPDGVVFQTLDLCDASTTGTPTNFIVVPARAMSQNVQASYAEKFGEWMFSAAVLPQPFCAVAMPLGYPVTASHCGCQTSVQDYAAYGAFVTPAQITPRGGAWRASIDVPYDATGDWLIDVKTV